MLLPIKESNSLMSDECEMMNAERIHIPLRSVLVMIWNYARVRLLEQLSAVAFIVAYLALFQMIVLGAVPADAWKIGFGIGLVVFGLTFFLEGLLLGLMPLGERVGIRLPQAGGLLAVALFGLLLGIGSTLAEPAVAALRVMGSAINAWEAPLLFHLLQNDPQHLVIAIGVGVGISVAVGMLRLYFGTSIKPLIYAIIPILLVSSLIYSINPKLAALLGLAWDSGAVTTGPVTVPLVIALGIGVSRSIAMRKNPSSGFGIIMLASAFPVLAVLVLGFITGPKLPPPTSEAEFFAPHHRMDALRIFSDEESLEQHAFRNGSIDGRRAFYGDAASYSAALESLRDPAERARLLGGVSLHDWLRSRADESERELLAEVPHSARENRSALPTSDVGTVFGGESAAALRAVVPLTLLLLATLSIFLKSSLRYRDEIALGIFFCLAGMTMLSAGIQLGLAPLGDSIGRSLPRVFRNTPQEEDRIVIHDFDKRSLIEAFGRDGSRVRFFQLVDERGRIQQHEFDMSRFDPESGRYTHVVMRVPLFEGQLTFAGIGLVLLFAFGLGYGSTLAEPALRALGVKVEEITVGTVRRRGMVRAVSIGVGIGLVAGTVRILFNIPTIWMIVPPYLLLLALTVGSEENFCGIAWDCGGVTTGPITVPLVMAMGLGIGGELHVVEGFGVMAMASAYPVITVLCYGMLMHSRQSRSVRTAEKDANE